MANWFDCTLIVRGDPWLLKAFEARTSKRAPDAEPNTEEQWPTPHPVTRTVGPSTRIVRFDFDHRYGAPFGWVAGVAKRHPSLQLDFLYWEDGFEVGGRACFEHGQPVLQQEVTGPRFNDYNRTHGWTPWFEEAGWVDEGASPAIDPANDLTNPTRSTP